MATTTLIVLYSTLIGTIYIEVQFLTLLMRDKTCFMLMCNDNKGILFFPFLLKNSGGSVAKSITKCTKNEK